MQSLRPYAIAGPPLILGEGQHLKQQWRRQSHPVGVLDPSFGVQAFPHEKICGVTSDEPIGGKPPATAEVSSSVLPPVSSAWSCRCGRGSPSQIERQGDFKETLPVQYCTGKKTTLPGTGTYRYRTGQLSHSRSCALTRPLRYWSYCLEPFRFWSFGQSLLSKNARALDVKLDVCGYFRNLYLFEM